MHSKASENAILTPKHFVICRQLGVLSHLCLRRRLRRPLQVIPGAGIESHLHHQDNRQNRRLRIYCSSTTCVLRVQQKEFDKTMSLDQMKWSGISKKRKNIKLNLNRQHSMIEDHPKWHTWSFFVADGIGKSELNRRARSVFIFCASLQRLGPPVEQYQMVVFIVDVLEF